MDEKSTQCLRAMSVIEKFSTEISELQEANFKFLLKFGKQEHIEEFVAGSLFCSSAKSLWDIEDTLKIKGQGGSHHKHPIRK